MKLIPSIDIIDGKCVRLVKGDYKMKKIYSDDLVSIAKSFEDAGVEYLHVIDLDGAQQRRIVNHKIVGEIARKTKLKIDFGGGINSDDDVKMAFDHGVNQVISGTVAAHNPELFFHWFETYGAEKIILAADCKNRKISTHAWQDVSSHDITEFIRRYVNAGVQYVICTDISRDGMLEGCAIDLYKKLMDEIEFYLIASGGVSSMEDIFELQEIGCDGCIFGKSFYENRISLSQISSFCA